MLYCNYDQFLIRQQFNTFTAIHVYIIRLGRFRLKIISPLLLYIFFKLMANSQYIKIKCFLFVVQFNSQMHLKQSAIM